MSRLTGTDYGAQRVQDDLTRRNRILERRIRILEYALKAERLAKNIWSVELIVGQKTRERHLLRRKRERKKCLLPQE